ncbi:hypothetical protein SAMN05216388_103814 [Halorientalis persicus]|uniref:Uncharacterized protein n=1 Tax=Halorientalis persicus TaxID=1367881 RepID=A0A1H8VIL2_9EURY|nr:hypothetical protein SAMN05216388_103814 [Halorientalis persicus]
MTATPISAQALSTSPIEGGQQHSDDQSSVNETDSGQEILYQGEHGKIVATGNASYRFVDFRGENKSETKANVDFLQQKASELSQDSNDSSSQNKSQDRMPSQQQVVSPAQSDMNSADGEYLGYGYDMSSNYDVTGSSGDLDFDGTVDANWWGEAYWHDDKLSVDYIKITSTLKGNYENWGTLTISIPPAYEKNLMGGGQFEAEVDNKDTENNHIGITHNPGALDIETTSCWQHASAHESSEFKTEDGELLRLGYDLEFPDIGSCWLG